MVGNVDDRMRWTEGSKLETGAQKIIHRCFISVTGQFDSKTADFSEKLFMVR